MPTVIITGMTMREIGSGEAETSFGQLLDRAEAGEEIVITRGGRAVARLLPLASPPDRVRATQAAAAIRDMSRGASLGGLTIGELVNAGRRRAVFSMPR